MMHKFTYMNISFLKVFLFIFICKNLTTFSCVYAQSNPHKAKYENNTHSLEFHEDGTFVETIKAIDILPFISWRGEDTIATGKYLYHKKKYFLYTSPNDRYSTLDMYVLRKEKTTDCSNLTVILNSPFELQKATYIDSNNAYKNAYFYMIKMTYMDMGQIVDTLYGPFFSNKIIIPLKNFWPKYMTIYIYPYEHSNRINPWFYCLQSHFSFENRDFNLYVFDIPNFKTMYAYWNRYDGKIVNIVGDNIITLDGVSFLTQGKKWKLSKKALSMLNIHSPFDE